MIGWKACWTVVLGLCVLGCGRSEDGEFRPYSSDAPPATTSDTTEQSDPTQTEDIANRLADDETNPQPQPGRLTQANPGDANSLPPTAPAVAERPENRQPKTDASVAAAENTEPQTPEPLEIKVLVPNNEFQEVGPENAVRVSYDDIDLLKVLNMDPVPADCMKYFPDWLKNLDGKRIRLRGFMYPPFQETDLPFFVLARDNAICCFGRDPKRYDVIDVTMRDGVTTDYIANRPFDVVGVFHIAPETSQGQLYQLYLIDDAIVIEP